MRLVLLLDRVFYSFSRYSIDICESRDLVNEQADVCTPEYIMNLCLEKQKKYNFQLEILDVFFLSSFHSIV